jgi:ABC-type sugar transport system ATPase subunit
MLLNIPMKLNDSEKKYRMFELKNIRKSFDDVHVLIGVNLRLENGILYTLQKSVES